MQLRGTLTMLFQLCVVTGILVAQAINVGTSHLAWWGWRLSLGLSAVPGFILLVGGLLLPETPNSLIERGYLQKVAGPVRDAKFLRSVQQHGHRFMSTVPCNLLPNASEILREDRMQDMRYLALTHQQSHVCQGLINLQGRAVLEAIRGTADVDEEYGTIVYAQRREKAEGKNQFRGIVRKDLRPHLIMSIALPFFQQAQPLIC